MIQLDGRGIAIIEPEVIPEITFDSPESAIGSMEVSFETMQLMAEKAQEQLATGNVDGVRLTLLDAIRYAGFQRARIKAYEETQDKEGK